MDEPTSSLDQQSEELALRAIAQWIGKRTLVVVTHRPQVLKLVNRVIVMENGQIVLDGPKDKVLAELAKRSNPKPAATIQKAAKTEMTVTQAIVKKPVANNTQAVQAVENAQQIAKNAESPKNKEV
jgi:ATP-binding cassette subfamily C protein LapB